MRSAMDYAREWIGSLSTLEAIEDLLTEYGDARTDEALEKAAQVSFKATCSECEREIRALKSTAKNVNITGDEE